MKSGNHQVNPDKVLIPADSNCLEDKRRQPPLLMERGFFVVIL